MGEGIVMRGKWSSREYVVRNKICKFSYAQGLFIRVRNIRGLFRTALAQSTTSHRSLTSMRSSVAVLVLGQLLFPALLFCQEPILIQGPYTGIVESFAHSSDGKLLVVSYRGCDLITYSEDGGMNWSEAFTSIKEQSNQSPTVSFGIDARKRIWMYSRNRNQLFCSAPDLGSWNHREEYTYHPVNKAVAQEFYVDEYSVAVLFQDPSGLVTMWIGDVDSLVGEVVRIPAIGSGVSRENVSFQNGVLSVINRELRTVYRYTIRDHLWDSISFGAPFQATDTIGPVGYHGEYAYAFHDSVLYVSSSGGARWERAEPEVRLSKVWGLSGNEHGAVMLGPEGVFVWRKNGDVTQMSAPFSEFVFPPAFLRTDGHVLFGSNMGLFVVGPSGSSRQIAGVPDISDLYFTDSAMYAVVRSGLLRRAYGEELFTPVNLPQYFGRVSLPEISTHSGDTVAFYVYHRMWISPDGGRSWSEESDFDSRIESLWNNGFGWYADLEGRSVGEPWALAASVDGGTTWSIVEAPDDYSGIESSSQFSRTPDVFPGPLQSRNQIYWIERGYGNVTSTVRAFVSEDGGVSWTQRTYPDSSASGSRYHSPGLRIERGTHSLSLHLDTSTVLLVYPDMFDTLMMGHALSAYELPTRFGDYYLASAFPPDGSFHAPAARFRWRHVEREEWYTIDLMPGKYVDYSSRWSWRAPERSFVLHNDQLYALSLGQRLWCLGSVDRLQEYLKPFRVTVENGYGSGLYLPGDTVHIWSRELNPDEVSTGFFESPIDTNFMHRAREWHTTFIMPPQDVVVTAGFDTLSLPLWQESTLPDEISGAFTVTAALPAGGAVEPRGAVLVIGDAKSAPADFFTRVESNWFVRDALARKFSVIAFRSEESVRGDLDDNDSINWNIDFSNAPANTDARRAKIVAEAIGNVADGKRLPVWILALGGDGDFAARLARELDAPAVAFTTALPKRYLLDGMTSPALFAVPSGDSLAQAFAGDRGEDLWQVHTGNGRTSLYARHFPSPLFRNRFARIEGIDTAVSQAIAAELVGAGILSDTDMRPDGSYRHIMLDRSSFDRLLAVGDTSVLRSLTPMQQEEVWRQLTATAAGSTFFSDLNELILDFFSAHGADPGESGVRAGELSIPDLDLTSRP